MKKNGFTLLEIIIVLSLVTLILGMSSFFFAGFLPSAKAGAAGREMSGMIRHARTLAMMNRDSRSFVIDLDNRTYGIEGQAQKTFPPGSIIKIIDPHSGEIVRGEYAVIFSPAGGMSGGTIILTWGKKTMRIDLDPIAGAVLLKGA